MKLKNLLIVFIAFASFTTTYAQNTTMAKAYLKKAQDAIPNNYTNYNFDYKEAFDYIVKCKEQLNGETNPEIIYLEAKIRYRYDRNLTKTKELINQFMNEAFEDDERIDEMASLLIDIESSDDFCNGHRKVYTFINKDGNIQNEIYDLNCKLEQVTYYKDDNKTRFFENRKMKRVIYNNRKGTKTIGYDDEGRISVEYTEISLNKGMGKLYEYGEVISEYTLTRTEKISQFFYSWSSEQASYYAIVENTSGKLLLSIPGWYENTYDNGIIKECQVGESWELHEKFYFSKDGYPLRKKNS